MAATPNDRQFTIVEADGLRLIGSGNQTRLRVVVRNDGDIEWARDRPIRLSYRWRGILGGKVGAAARTDLPEAVAPGASVELSAKVTAPLSGGLYSFEWDVVEERVGWFSETDPTPEPRRWVVVPPVQTGPFWLLFAAVTGAAAAAGGRLGSGRRFERWVLPEADLLWLILSLLIKQRWVLISGDWQMESGALWIAVSSSALVALPLLLFSQRWRPWVSWTVGAGLSLLFFADVIYVRFFFDLPSFAVFGAAEQTGQVTDSIRALLEWGDLWFFADLVPALYLVYSLSRKQCGRQRRLAAAAVCLLLLVPGAQWAWSTANARRGRSLQRFFQLRLAEKVGVLGYHLVDLHGVVMETLWGYRLTDADWQTALDILEERRPQRAGVGEYYGSARGFNLVMIQAESLQGQTLDLEVDGQEITPHLNRLAAESISLTLCLDQTQFGRTSDAELLSQTSLLPAPRGAAVFRHAGNDLVGIADVLSERGYTTLVAIPYRPSFWNRRYSHPAFGFETRLYDDDFEPGLRVGWGLNDRDFLRQAADRLATLPEPWCAFLITLSNHHPYKDMPEEFQVLDLEGVGDPPLRGYLHSAHWADEAIGLLLERLEESGLADRTVVAIWGDHGAGLDRVSGAAGALGMPSSRPDSLLADRVPVVIRVPGADPPRGAIELPTGLSDLAPTIAALLGIDPADLPWLGRNLLGAPEAGPVVMGAVGWVDGEHVYYGLRKPDCHDRLGKRRVKVDQCAEGLAAATRLRDAGTLILEGDMQQPLRAALSGGSSGGVGEVP